MPSRRSTSHRKLIFLIAGAVIVLSVTGWFLLKDKKNSDAAQTTPQTQNGTTCDDIYSTTYQSVEMHEMGRSVTLKESQGYWKIVFTNSDYVWTHSDMVTRGTFTCKDGVITAKDAGGGDFEARFDAESGELIWGSERYIKEKQ